MQKKKPLKVRIAVYILLLLLLLLILPKILGLSTFSFSFEDPNLANIVNKNISGKEGDYAIYIEDLSSGEKYGKQEQVVFPSASLYKLFLFAAVMEQVESGKLSMDTGISAQKDYLIERFRGVDFGYEDRESTITYTIEEAMTRVGRISDNFAAIMLGDKVGWDNIQKSAQKLGAKNTTIKSPISTTAYDVALFFKALYSGKVVSSSASAQISKFLLLSNINDRIPEYLPEGTKVVHKTGELSRVRHDAGIVYPPAGGGKPYVLVLMSKDLQYEDEAIETLANISKDVFDYFKSKTK